MNFFERQHAARGTTVRLVLLFTAAVLAIIILVDVVVLILARPPDAASVIPLLIGVSVVTISIIAGGTLFKMLALRAGGSAVALSVGAVPIDPTTSDPALRRFVNIVEEMSLASGVPVPRLFVLEKEPGINAFAAGYTPADAAITVTAGALQQLNRDELQGVIGHEFSHVLNGDMRLNVRLIGLLNGILLLGLIGIRVLYFGGGRGGDRKGGGAPIIVIAIAFTILGFAGRFFANLIKAAVSRQREWLADASAVQFTRQTTGLEGALKKIAGVPTGSALTDARGAQEVSHMLFGEGGKSFSQLFATHPPLYERIKALDPAFRPEEIEQLQAQWQAAPPNGQAEDVSLGLAGRAQIPPPQAPPTPAATVRTTAAELSARVGTLTPEDLERGAALSAQIPPELRQLASQGSTVIPLVLAMVLDSAPAGRAAQLEIVADRMGSPAAAAAAGLADLFAVLPPQLRLPVVSIAAPLIAAHPKGTLDVLVPTLEDLARADGSISVFEYCLTRLIAGYIRDAKDPAARSRPGRTDVRRVDSAAFTLLAAVAATGNDDPAAAQRAFGAAVAALLPGAAVPYQPPMDTWRVLDGVWAPLDGVDPGSKQRLIEALVIAIRDDGDLTLNEAELLRTTCALLHCPLPAFVA
ncbi:MAG: peptidase M48 [Pseudonocardiales bacterium]|nr:MAG: peptidase M48 [Pseudonocardiales bacterium]